MLDFKLENLPKDTLEIWNKEGIKAGVSYLFNYEEYLNVLQASQILELIFREFGIVRYNKNDLSEIIEKILMYKNNIEILLSQVPNPDGKYKEFCDEWKEAKEKYIDELVLVIEDIFKDVKKQDDFKVIEGMNSEEFIEFIFDRQKNPVSNEVVFKQINKFMDNNCISFLQNSKVNKLLINEIIALQDRLVMMIHTETGENYLKTQINNKISIIKDELKDAFFRKSEMDKEEALKIEVIDIYKQDGLRSALKYLFNNGVNTSIYEVFNKVIYQIYRMNKVTYEPSPYWNRYIEDIMNHIKTIQSVMELSRGYKGEMRLEDIKKIEEYGRKINSVLTKLVNEIIEDFNINRINMNLSVSDFVSRLFEQKYEDRTVPGIYNQIYNYFDYRGIKLENDNNFKEVIQSILDLNESFFIKSPLQAFKDDNSKDMSEVNHKIDELIVLVQAHLMCTEHELLTNFGKKTESANNYHAELENISRENGEMYAQIHDLQRRIEENEERKRILIEEWNKEKGLLKK